MPATSKSEPRLLFIAGSAREKSWNKKLARLGHHIADANGIASAFADLGDYPMPIYNGDIETESGSPDNARKLKALMKVHSGIFIASPEYNASFSALLKNALDWVSRPPASSPMRGKPIGLVGAASGMSGTIRAQTHMRQMLVYSDSPCLNQPEVLIPRAQDRFDVSGKLIDESTRQLLVRFGQAMIVFVGRYRRA